MGCMVAQGQLFGRPVPIAAAPWATMDQVLHPTA
jgi:EAL domain-containing protein (putative c-di-GMP-specific phosphodiesterase class I)